MGGGSSSRRRPAIALARSGTLGAAAFRRQLARWAPPGCEALLREAGREAIRAGNRASLVGGAVRDLLLGRPLREPDIVVEGDAIALARALARRWNGTLAVHETFGTASIHLSGGGRVDLVTARAEHYRAPAALPSVAPGSLDDDARRRDFTINTLRVDLSPGHFGRLHDPQGGLADLQARRIRVLHARSFMDDPTRAYRAVRFAARLGFRIEPVTARLIAAASRSGVFDRLSPRRLRVEIARALDEEDPVRIARLLARHELLRPLSRGLDAGPRAPAALRRASAALDRLRRAEAGGARWVSLLLVLAWPLTPSAAAALAARLDPERAPRRALEQGGAPARALARRLVAARGRPPSRVRSICAPYATEVVIAVAAREPRAARAVLGYLEHWRHVRPDIDGNDLLAAGVRPGPAVARGLAAALAARLDRGAGPPEQLRAALAAARRSRP